MISSTMMARAISTSPSPPPLEVVDGRIHVDFAGTAPQTKGNVNCPLSVAAAGVYYLVRCLMPAQTPACAGTFRPITLSAPVGSLFNAERPAAVPPACRGSAAVAGSSNASSKNSGLMVSPPGELMMHVSTNICMKLYGIM